MKKTLYILLIIIGFSCSQANENPIVIAHRGASAFAPENTIASVNKAWEMNADAVEVDVMLTKDNKIICCHDKNTKRTTGKSYIVNQTLADTLRSLDAGYASKFGAKFKGEKLPFLSEVVASLPKGKKLFIEVKSNRKEIIQPLVKFLQSSSKKEQLILIAFNLEIIKNIKAQVKEIPAYYLAYGLATKLKFQTALKLALDAGLDGLDVQFQSVTEETNKILKEYKTKAYVWTVNKKEDYQKLLKFEVAGITTDNPLINN
jgi:glycerophosphoryl diester phosphodiesterase